MKKIFIILISIVFTGVYAQDYKELIKNTAGSDKYPDASAINVYTKVNINVNTDGSSTKHVYYIKKILTYKGKNRYSDVKLTYNANIEKIELGECFSVRNGEKIAIPKEAIHDNESYMMMYSPEYINERQKVVNFPAIEPNDFIIVDYTITLKPKDYFSGIEQMQEANPYLQKEFTITTAKDFTLIYDFKKDKIKFEKTEKDNKITYKWSVKNVPLIKDEKNKPSFSIIGRPIFYSTKKNWEAAANIYFKQFNATNYDTKEIAALVKEYANSKMSDETKLSQIYAYIQDNFEFKYAYNEDGFTPQASSKVLNQKFGSSKELTALFIAMAKAANIKVQKTLVIGNTDLTASKKISCSDFSAGIFAYYHGKLISFRTQYLPFGTTWFEKAYLILADNPKEIIDYKSNTKKLISKIVNIKLNSDYTANAQFQKTLKGTEDFSLRRSFKNETEKKRKIWFTSDISDKSISLIGDPVFKNLNNYTQNLQIIFNAKINNYYKEQGNYIYFKLPEPEKVSVSLTGNKRATPYQTRGTYSVTEKYIYENIPSGTIIKPKTEIYNSYKDDKTEMYFKITSKRREDKIIITREIFIPSTIISVEDYPRFYKFISEIQKPLNNMVFLKE